MIEKSVFLGEPGDPEPIWRAEAPDAFEWPESAAFAVTFSPERFENTSRWIRERLPLTEFYGADGWPLDLPEERKTLPIEIRQDFQVFPNRWSDWNERTWKYAQEFPEMLRRSRALAALSRPIAELTSKLASES